MSRSRTRPITDIHLTEHDVKQLKKGYKIYKMAHKHTHCLYLNGSDRKTQRKIEQLKEQIRLLKGEKK